MDINREMELMLAENDIETKPKKNKKKKQNAQKDGLQLPDSANSIQNMLMPETLL